MPPALSEPPAAPAEPPAAPRLPPPGPLTPVRRQLLEAALAGEAEIVPVTTDVYHGWIAQGIHDPTVELIDGLLVRKIRGDAEDPLSQGDEHALGVALLVKLDGPVTARGGHVRIQSPVVLDDLSEPEPDGAVVAGPLRAMKGRLPTAADCSCVIEVMESSAARDRGPKRADYARSRVRQYVRVDVRGRAVEVDEDPDPAAGTYRASAVVGPGGTVALLMPDGSRLDVPADDLLP